MLDPMPRKDVKMPMTAREAEMQSRIEELEAKLAQAVETLHTISGHMVLNNEGDEELSDSALIARATLAELKGEANDQ